MDCRTIKVQPKDICGKNIKNESLDLKGERKGKWRKGKRNNKKGGGKKGEKKGGIHAKGR